MAISFQKHVSDSLEFTQILPLDWQEALALVWEKAEATVEIYVLKEEDKIIAGGMVFKEYTNDMVLFKKEAKKHIANKSYYIGYLWVIESRRGENLGSLWLDEMKEKFPKTNFWLTIEEESLIKFYTKNGFQLQKVVEGNEGKEWLLVFVLK